MPKATFVIHVRTQPRVALLDTLTNYVGRTPDSLFIYCRTIKFSSDKFPLSSPSKSFHSFNFHYSMAVHCYIITKVNILDAFNFHGFASSAKIPEINCWRNLLVLQYPHSGNNRKSTFRIYRIILKKGGTFKCVTGVEWLYLSIAGHESHQLLRHHSRPPVCLIHRPVLRPGAGSAGARSTQSIGDGWCSTDAQ